MLHQAPARQEMARLPVGWVKNDLPPSGSTNKGGRTGSQKDAEPDRSGSAKDFG